MLTSSGIDFGTLSISYFSLTFLAALGAALLVTVVIARIRGRDASALYDVALWGLFAAIVVGRLFYVLNPPPSVARFYSREWYFQHLLDFQLGPLTVWNGGLSRAGMAVGMALAAWGVLHRQEGSLREWADILTPGALVFLSIAPWGNVLMKQMFGPPTALPWAVRLAERVPPYGSYIDVPPSMGFHPTPAYVALWSLAALLVWIVLRRVWASRERPGSEFLLAAGLAAPGLFLFDFLRVDVSTIVLGLTAVQILALLAMLAAFLSAARSGLRALSDRFPIDEEDLDPDPRFDDAVDW